MKKISILCLLLLSALMLLVGCKADPEAINNTPEVFADEASDVLRTSAVLTGRIMAPAKASIKEYGFLVSSSSDFTSSDTQTIKCDENLKEFSAQITDLEIGGTYFYAAYATGGLDRMTSTVRAFTTPTRSGVLLSDLRMVDEKTATFSARVADTGGGEINAVGLCWATDNTPTTYDETVITTLNSDNTFTASLTGLEAGKTYYVRAFADSDILGDGTTQTISYSRDVLEITLEEELPEPEPDPEPIWMLSGSLQGGENEIYFVEDSERGMFVAEDVNLTLWCRFKVYNVEDRGVAYGYADQTRTTHDMVDARLPLDLNGEDIEPTHAGVFDIWFDLDGKYLYIMSDGKTPEEADDYEPKPTGPASNEIWYTSTDGNIVEPYDATGFGVNIVSNTYENGKGVIAFDGPITSIGEYAFLGCKLETIALPDNLISIGGSVFQQCELLTSITIPDSVTSIGAGAFAFCYSLTNVTIPDSVTSIGGAAFQDCDSLTSITIPDSVISIGHSAFNGCDSLTAFYGKFASEDNLCLIIDGVLNSFAIGCGAIEYTIPYSVTSIGGSSFISCGSLISVTIPNSVTEIGVHAFGYCTGLTSVTIPDSVTSVGASAFSGCTSLTAFYGKYATEDNLCLIVDGVLNGFAIGCGATEYSIPNGITSIGDNAFSNCSSLKSITIPDGVTMIGHSAFYRCTSLTSVTIPDSVTSIEGYAFAYCSSLTSITIPDNVTSIGWYAFFACTSLKEVYCNPTTPPVGDYDIFEYNAADRKIYVPAESVNAYKAATYWSEYADSIYPMDGEEQEVPETWKIFYTSTDGNIVEPKYTTGFGANIVSNTYENGQGVILFDGPVTSIGDGAFRYCTGLTSVTIPDSVTSIGSGAFEDCSGLTSVTIPDSVTSIGERAFLDCTGLTSITIPDSVTSIENYAFQSTGLTSITIPDSVTSIGIHAFYNCTGLTSITIPESVTSIGEHAFSGCTSLTAFYGKFATEDNLCLIVNGVLNAFAIGSGATEYAIPDSVTSIGGSAFYYCTSLTSVTIPDSVISIGGRAFSGCTGVTSVTIGNGVTEIGMEALYNCTGLTSITIPESVTSIGEHAFSGCTSLTAFYGKFATEDNLCLIVNGVLNGFAIGSGATEYTIPDSVTTIEYGAFQDCDSLTSITIPNSVTSIGIAAFESCTGLTSVTIGNGVTSIGYRAFNICTGLTSVYCKPTTPPAGDSYMFDDDAYGRKIYVPNASVDAYKAAEYWSDYASDIVGYDF